MVHRWLHFGGLRCIHDVTPWALQYLVGVGFVSRGANPTAVVDRLKTELPITPLFFDALYPDGSSLVDADTAATIQRIHQQATRG
jgi:hypothetical protein